MFADIDMDSLSSVLTEVNGLKTFHTSFVSFLKGIDAKYKKYESTIEENLEEITNLKKEVEYYKTNYVPHDVSLMKKYIDEVQICNKERKILEKQNTNLKLAKIQKMLCLVFWGAFTDITFRFNPIRN